MFDFLFFVSFLLFCWWYGCIYRDPLESQRRVAMISEMIHTASLIHDDVIDQSNFRRGKPSVNVLWNHRKVSAWNQLVTQFYFCFAGFQYWQSNRQKICYIFALCFHFSSHFSIGWMLKMLPSGFLIVQWQSYSVFLQQTIYTEISTFGTNKSLCAIHAVRCICVCVVSQCSATWWKSPFLTLTCI